MKGTTTDRTEAEERRRTQNRLAQRRFRQKHRQRKVAEQRARNCSLSSEAPSLQDECLDSSLLLEPQHISIASSISSPSNNALVGFPALSDDAFLSHNNFSDLDTLWPPALQSCSTPSTLQLLDSGDSGSASPLMDPSVFSDSNSLLRGSISSMSSISSSGGGAESTKPFDDVKNSFGSFWTSPLHIAVQKGNGRIVRLLLDHDADYDRKDSAGLTPLLHATIAGHEEVAEMLLLHGASIHHVDNYHRSALHLAVLHRREGLLRKLLKRCSADGNLLNGHTKEGRSPLCIAVDMGFEKAVELLLEFGAKVR